MPTGSPGPGPDLVTLDSRAQDPFLSYSLNATLSPSPPIPSCLPLPRAQPAVAFFTPGYEMGILLRISN